MSVPNPLAHSILDLIGGTPLLELHRCVAARGLQGRLLAKLELFNPAGSKKDRAALEIIKQAKAEGLLVDGQTVVELTSGNMGAGLAIVCRALGHPFVAVISQGNSVERIRQMKALGAEVVIVDQSPGSIPGQVSGADLALVEDRAKAVVAEHQAFRADQFVREANCLAHERTTGPEIWDQSGGEVDVFLDLVGTCGTYTGVARALRIKNQAIRTYLVEPAGAAVLAGLPVTQPRHKLQGAGYGRTNLALFDPALVTGYLQVTDSEAEEAARFLAAEEGILAGFSTGANLAAAWQLLAGPESGATIAFLACDSGLKYLSTDLFP
ncbi:PLP-dependent cysteine synthase family protein [Singulisphaera acidiphila]|uniref:Cysteine synthase n=1 Tax=Singulisphaera acidiphila (strain ATCC BAA-1392 / DSM 18658 / VKM B-2454 / MOB10) TaxID=886293 RepID=L0DBL0_SINAD|nr:cysteine synthase family protein [Singulisphaera acidiphila]AGA26632.1 cysteine synthase [Singulisphaera acidiphila DSM 18658]